MPVKEKIQKYIDYKGISIYRLEADAGMSKGYWSKTKSISADVAVKISRVYSDISAEWLLRDEGDMIRVGAIVESIKPTDAKPDVVSSFYERAIERKEKKIEELTLMVGRLQYELEVVYKDKKRVALQRDNVICAAASGSDLEG